MAEIPYVREDSSSIETPPSAPTPSMSAIQKIRARTKPLAFAVICGSLSLDSFNVTGLTYGQLDIAQRYNVIPATASWSLSAYALTFGSLLLLAGRAGDMYGHKSIYSFGLVFFSLFAALSAGIDSSFIALCILRALQGAAAACTVPTAYAIVGITYSGQARELAVAGLGVSSTTGAIIGSIAGGAFAQTTLGYRGILWTSFAASTVMCGLAFLLLEPTPRDPNVQQKPLDVLGAFMVTAAGAILVYGFTEAPTGWHQTKVIAPIIIGVCLFILFIIWEQYGVWRFFPKVDPLIPRRVWAYHNIVPLAVETGFLFSTFYLAVLNGSTFLLRVQGRRTLISAVMWSPLIIGTLIFCILMAPFYNHKVMPPKWLLVTAPIILAAGVILISRNEIQTGYWKYTFSGAVVMSLGTAIFFINYLNVAYAATPAEDQGLVSGIIQTSAQIATALGLAIGSSFLSADTPAALLPQYRNSFWVAVAFGGAGSLVALFFIKPIPSKVAPQDAEDVEKIVPEAAPEGAQIARDTEKIATENDSIGERTATNSNYTS